MIKMKCFEFIRICDNLVECLHSKTTDSCLHFPTLRLSTFNTTIKNYSLLVELNQQMKQLRMDRNSKEIKLAKLNSRISVTLLVAAEPTLRAKEHVQFSGH